MVRTTPVSQAANGVCYATSGENSIGAIDLERMIAAVPAKGAAALNARRTTCSANREPGRRSPDCRSL